MPKGYYPLPFNDPYADETTQPFWDAALKGKLLGAKCKKCGTFRIPPHPRCFICQSTGIDWVELPGTGTIYSYTVVRHPLRPDMRDAVPYVGAVVNLDGTQGAGARMLVNIVDCDVDKVKVGDKVKVKFDRISETLAFPRFTPA